MLGNNMFAYCGNNPVTGYDPTGHVSMINYMDNDGSLTAGWLALAAGVGGFSPDGTFYLLNTPKHKSDKEILNDAGTFLGKVGNKVIAFGKQLWDAYVRGYNLQQNAQMQEAQMMIDAGNAVCALYMELTMQYESELALLGGIDNVCSGIDNICTGFGRILVPEPTVVNDVIGVGQATYGVIQVAFGLVEIIIWSLEESEK